MFERFTPEARAIVADAQHAALAPHHNYIGTEHLLLLGVLAGQHTTACRTLADLGVTADTVRGHVVDLVGRGPSCPADADALAAIGIDLDHVRERVEAQFGPGALERGQPMALVRPARQAGVATRCWAFISCSPRWEWS